MYRDEETLIPHPYYCKLPGDLSSREVIIVDPMLAGVDISPSAADAGFDGRLVPGQTVTYVSGAYTVTAANTTAGKVTNTATAKAVNALNKTVTSNTATASIPTTPTKVIIKTGSGAGPAAGTLQGPAGALLLLGAAQGGDGGRRNSGGGRRRSVL